MVHGHIRENNVPNQLNDFELAKLAAEAYQANPDGFNAGEITALHEQINAAIDQGEKSPYLRTHHADTIKFLKCVRECLKRKKKRRKVEAVA